MGGACEAKAGIASGASSAGAALGAADAHGYALEVGGGGGAFDAPAVLADASGEELREWLRPDGFDVAHAAPLDARHARM